MKKSINSYSLPSNFICNNRGVFKSFFLLGFLWLSFCVVVKAQDDSVKIRAGWAEAVRKIPLQGKNPADFVPAGWEIKGEVAKGDLNADGAADYAFDITPINDSDESYDAVVVVFSEKGGNLRKIGTNDALSDNGFGTKQAVTIEKGILISNTNFGNNDATDVTFRFRYDAAAGKLMLIGFDYETYGRSGNKNGYKTSYNFLTGVRQDTTDFVDRRKNAKEIYSKSATKNSKIERVKISFEKARLNWGKDGVAPLPY